MRSTRFCDIKRFIAKWSQLHEETNQKRFPVPNESTSPPSCKPSWRKECNTGFGNITNRRFINNICVILVDVVDFESAKKECTVHARRLGERHQKPGKMRNWIERLRTVKDLHSAWYSEQYATDVDFCVQSEMLQLLRTAIKLNIQQNTRFAKLYTG